MSCELDHVFICCAPGAPEAAVLLQLGLTEGSGNVHPGQGTTCRRFFFHNAYLELIWVSDPAEAQNPRTRPTRLWERWAGRGRQASPFAAILRAAGAGQTAAPFPTWAYHPEYLPPELAIEVAADVPLGEPELFYFPTSRRPDQVGREPLIHAIPLHQLTRVTIGMPPGAPLSAAAQAAAAAGVLAYAPAADHLMTLDFTTLDPAEGAGANVADVRPELPLVLRW